ncbi:hypothetical protein HT737_29345, partial [Pseudomonas sp. MD195_PC81_125]|nr:hypothetical protein [Pseudomonas sp. MD195_PC81_125]
MIIKIKMSLSHQCLIPTMAAINKTLELFVMALAHSLGFPRIGRDRELKKAQEAFWKGEL